MSSSSSSPPAKKPAQQSGPVKVAYRLDALIESMCDLEPAAAMDPARLDAAVLAELADTARFTPAHRKLFTDMPLATLRSLNRWRAQVPRVYERYARELRARPEQLNQLTAEDRWRFAYTFADVGAYSLARVLATGAGVATITKPRPNRRASWLDYVRRPSGFVMCRAHIDFLATCLDDDPRWLAYAVTIPKLLNQSHRLNKCYLYAAVRTHADVACAWAVRITVQDDAPASWAWRGGQNVCRVMYDDLARVLVYACMHENDAFVRAALGNRELAGFFARERTSGLRNARSFELEHFAHDRLRHNDHQCPNTHAIACYSHEFERSYTSLERALACAPTPSLALGCCSLFFEHADFVLERVRASITDRLLRVHACVAQLCPARRYSNLHRYAAASHEVRVNSLLDTELADDEDTRAYFLDTAATSGYLDAWCRAWPTTFRRLYAYERVRTALYDTKLGLILHTVADFEFVLSFTSLASLERTALHALLRFGSPAYELVRDRAWAGVGGLVAVAMKYRIYPVAVIEEHALPIAERLHASAWQVAALRPLMRQRGYPLPPSIVARTLRANVVIFVDEPEVLEYARSFVDGRTRDDLVALTRCTLAPNGEARRAYIFAAFEGSGERVSVLDLWQRAKQDGAMGMADAIVKRYLTATVGSGSDGGSDVHKRAASEDEDDDERPGAKIARAQ